MYSFRIDDFDSGVFGFKVAKIAEINPKHVKNLVRDLIKNKVRYATYRVQSNDYPLIHALEASGFILVDGLISLSIDVSLLHPGVDGQIREAQKSDLGELKKITAGLYSITRVTYDPMTRKHADKYYTKWIENSVSGQAADSVLVWAPPQRDSAPAGGKGKALGYVTLQKKGQEGAAQRGSAPEGQIPLLGVVESARGKGIARSLLTASFAKFKEWGIARVNIDTQMGNIPALRAYQGAGFKIVDSHLTFRWAP